ncbi:MAG TPA: GvpL/GvpF family gas vesicle protein [Vicinamibacterales bacterium]|nr:GvpL/GvpF family gas vesicle protein [Vicinamibacterales bacterium]
MILYLYAIAEGLEHVDDIRGAAGEPLKLLALEGLQVVTGEIDTAPRVDERSLSRQDEVVRRLQARAAALLPMRFGAAFASTADMQRALGLRAPTLRERLALVRGAEQMTARILAPAAPRAPASTAVSLPASGGRPAAPAAPGAAGALGGAPAGAKGGARYLRARAARAMPQEIVPLLDILKPLTRAARVEPGKAPAIIATVYLLIDRGTSAEFEAAVQTAAGAMPGLSIRITGPAPCYAFA